MTLEERVEELEHEVADLQADLVDALRVVRSLVERVDDPVMLNRSVSISEQIQTGREMASAQRKVLAERKESE